MAYLADIFCTSCKETKKVSVGADKIVPQICPECEEVVSKGEKEEFLTNLAKLPLEERLSKLESWVYDHSKVRHGYISPPSF